MIKIALPNKGRLAEDTRELLEAAGLGIRMPTDRTLVAELGEEYQAIFVRSQDIPEFVADGAAQAGVTGWDLVSESGRELVDRLDLGFGRCRVVVAARDDSGIESLDEIPPGARVATVFPRIAARFFAYRGQPIELVPVSGATEIAPHLGIADVIVDIVSTGSTLKMNGLRELGTVLDSSARLVTGPGAAEARAPLDRLAIRAGARVVDLGCGPGHVVAMLAERFGADNGRIARIIMTSTVLAFGSFTLLAWAFGAR